MRRTVLLILVVAASLGATAPDAGAASYRSCRPVRNPYPHTRYAGVDLTHIRALHVSCATARHVARRAHRKALRVRPSADGIRRFGWGRWRVRGDLRPAHDRYVASLGARRVRWRF
jgi:hypothetical protein